MCQVGNGLIARENTGRARKSRDAPNEVLHRRCGEQVRRLARALQAADDGRAVRGGDGGVLAGDLLRPPPSLVS